MTRREIFLLILGEAGLLGVLGAALGLVLGVILGQGAVQMVTQTVNDLFFAVAVREMEIPVCTLVKGGCDRGAGGPGGRSRAGLGGDQRPASRRAQALQHRRAHPPPAALAGGSQGLCCMGLGLLLMIPAWSLVLTFAGLFAIVLGAALLTPLLTLWLMQGVERLVRGAGVVERMAPRTVIRSLSRMAVAVAALMVAVSVIIGVGVMIASFRQTVELWLDDVLQADIFVSPLRPPTSLQTTLDPGLLRAMTAFPGIAGAASTRSADVTAQLHGRRRPDRPPGQRAEPGPGWRRAALPCRRRRLARRPGRR